MRKVFLLAMIALSFRLAAQTEVYYVAAKSGLSIREKPDAAAKVLDKISYGTKIILLDRNEEMNTIKTEGMLGYWRKVKYNNKTGYIVDSYLFPVAPPKAGIKTMKEYFAQLALPFGSKLVVKSGTMNNIEDGGWELDKQLYKNGAEWHHYTGYEEGSDTYFLPGFNLKQAFLLLRLIPEFEQVFTSKDEFPAASKTIKKGQIDYTITVESEEMTEEPWVKRISIEYEDGAVYSFEMYQADRQIVIVFGGGV